MKNNKKASPEEILDAVDVRRKRAETKALDISLNELADMHESKELVIRPEFQRLFRWPKLKQSQFIESLILEMPVPAIFVIEIEEGKWELIDGLQRISSYLHFRGNLDAPAVIPPIKKGSKLKLEGCDILTELNGTTYDELPLALQIRLKRSFLRVETIRKETGTHFRYYMFKRLNTGGEDLSDQEIRNCTIRLLGEKFNNFLIDCSNNSAFKNVINKLSDDKRRQMFDIELVLRFFAFKNNFSEFKHDLNVFLTNYMERVTDTTLADAIDFDYKIEKQTFEKVFETLNESLGERTCIRWLGQKYGGQFLIHHYEAMTLGLAKALARPTKPPPITIKKKLEEAKKDERFKNLTTGGGKNSPGPYRNKIDFIANLFADS